MPTKPARRSTRIDPFENTVASSFQRSSTCWRTDWDSGGESIYALLAQYAALNAISTSHLCKRFVHRTELPVSRSAAPSMLRRFHLIDLRYSDGLKLQELCQALHLTEVELRSRFVCEFAPDQATLTSRHLVWCSRCAEEGRHFVTFQLSAVRNCPLHAEELLRRCPHCKQLIAYELRNSNKSALFVCPHCTKDFAPKLRSTQGKVSSPVQRTGLVTRHLESIKVVAALPMMFGQVRAEIGMPHYPMHVLRPDLSRPAPGYSDFVTSFIGSVRVLAKSNPSDLSTLQFPFSVVGSKLTERRLPSVLRKSLKREDLARAEADIWAIYRSIRRQVLHHFVGRHEACVRVAQYNLWWNLEGEIMGSFCPVAIAFLRWRMQWEGCHIPSHLDRRERAAVPIGLGIWLECRPPVNMQYWTPAFIEWLNHHLLACDTMDTFAGWYELAIRDHSKRRVQWQKEDSKNFALRNWACCGGRGVHGEPGYFCYDRHTSFSRAPPLFPPGHLGQVRLLLSLIKR